MYLFCPHIETKGLICDIKTSFVVLNKLGTLFCCFLSPERTETIMQIRFCSNLASFFVFFLKSFVAFFDGSG